MNVLFFLTKAMQRAREEGLLNNLKKGKKSKVSITSKVLNVTCTNLIQNSCGISTTDSNHLASCWLFKTNTKRLHTCTYCVHNIDIVIEKNLDKCYSFFKKLGLGLYTYTVWLTLCRTHHFSRLSVTKHGQHYFTHRKNSVKKRSQF